MNVAAMHERFFELPPAAQQLVRTVEATIEEAAPLLEAQSAESELAFTFRETRARYLPETVAAFLAIPASQREVKDSSGHSAQELLMEQLSVLDRSTKRDLERLAAGKRSDLAANARFLAERFDDRSNEVSVVGEAAASPATGSFAPSLQQWLPQAGADAVQIVAVVAGRLKEHFPGITDVRTGGLFGMGRIEAVSLTLAQGGGIAFRYTLSASEGILEPSVAKLVHGTTIQTVRCSAQEWLESLYEDITAQARAHAELRAPLTRLFS